MLWHCHNFMIFNILQNNAKFSYFFSQCQQQWLDSNPWPFDDEASVLPLCHCHCLLTLILLPFSHSLYHLQRLDLYPWLYDDEAIVLSLFYCWLSTFILSRHFLSTHISSAGQTRTLNLWIMRWVFYHCVTPTSRYDLGPVLGQPFQPSLMFAGRLRPYLQTLDKAGKACHGQTL